MTVALDAVSSAGSSGSAGSITWTHTPVGTPTGVLVTVDNADSFVTGVTYGGVAMTNELEVQSDSTNTRSGSWWTLFAPAAGAQSITVSFNSTTTRKSCNAITVTGGSTTKVLKTASKTSATYSGLVGGTLSITAGSGELAFSTYLAVSKGGDTITPSQTSYYTNNMGDDCNFGSYTAAGTSGFTWTGTWNTNQFAIVAAIFEPAVTATQIDFPSSPSNGATYTYNSRTWTYNSATPAWLR